MRGSPAAQWVNDLMSSVQQLGSLLRWGCDPWPGNFCMPWAPSPQKSIKNDNKLKWQSQNSHLKKPTGSFWPAEKMDIRWKHQDKNPNSLLTKKMGGCWSLPHTTHTHTHTQRLENLNLKGKTIKLLEDNKGEYLYNIRVFLKKAFLDIKSTNHKRKDW